MQWFDAKQILFLSLSFVCLFTSILFHFQKKYTAAIFILFISSLCIHFFSAFLDPYLNLWDERFHALVAKNISQDSLLPMLYKDPLVAINYYNWDSAHIWLHKPPLFLWQIALSFKIFGYSELALRFPSILLSSLLTVISFRIGKLLTNNRIGFYCALFVTTSFYLVQLVSGKEGMDHNDVAFVFYVSASLWAWIEYTVSGKSYWVILVGILSGLAVLTKWLVGFLVYVPWIIYMITERPKTHLFHELRNLSFSLILTFGIFLPWRFYIFHTYAMEARYEDAYNLKHLTEAVEGHDGNISFHLANLSALYGSVAPYIILFALIALGYCLVNPKTRLAIFSIPIVTYTFFSLVQTKLPGYVFIVFTIIYLSFASLLYLFLANVVDKIKPGKLKPVIELVLLLFLCIANLNLAKIEATHTKKVNSNIVDLPARNKQIFQSLKDRLPPNTILFNVPGRHYVEAMYYSGFAAYNLIPNRKEYEKLKTAKRRIAVFSPVALPEYLANDTSVIVVKDAIQKFD